MLTRDLLRSKRVGDRIEPQFVRATPAIRELADTLLTHYRGSCGSRLGEVTDAALPLLHRSRALLIARGFQKLITDACTFAEPPDAASFRAAAFTQSAALLATPTADAVHHLGAVAAALASEPEVVRTTLYGDLPDQATIASAPDWSVQTLLERYNMALAQGFMLQAQRIRVRIEDTDTGLRRRLLHALRFRRLLASVDTDVGTSLQLSISGPGSLLDQATRYGLQLALFLPALACCAHWQAEVFLHAPRQGHAVMQLSSADNLVGDQRALGFVPPELRTLSANVCTKLTGWTVVDPPLLAHPSGELVVSDMALSNGEQTVSFEWFHRWHDTALTRRLDQIAAGWGTRHIIGIERSLIKRQPALAKHPIVQRQGFLFSDLPTVRALTEVLQRVVPA